MGFRIVMLIFLLTLQLITNSIRQYNNLILILKKINI
jgi:hypothetical protein